MASENRKKRQRGDKKRVVDLASVFKDFMYDGPEQIAISLFKIVDQGPPMKAQYETINMTPEAAQKLREQLARVLVDGADRGWEQ